MDQAKTEQEGGSMSVMTKESGRFYDKKSSYAEMMKKQTPYIQAMYESNKMYLYLTAKKRKLDYYKKMHERRKIK
jgi:hypothetical protein